MAEDRLQKIIARAGISSRRAAEELITKGRVRVNGKIVTELGTRANPSKDNIEIDGRRIVAEDFVYIVLHKPRLVVSTLDDPEGRPTVADLVRDAGARIHPVGRLDFHTSGTLLLTNDGELTNGLLHPRRAVDKTYVVKTQGEMTPEDIAKWENGIELDDGRTLPAQVHFDRHEGGKTWLEVTLIEGRNQQIRRMGEATGFPVMRLARLSFAGITTEGIPPGRWRHLTAEELMSLREAYGVPKRIRPSRSTDKPDTTAWRPGPRPTHGKGGAHGRDDRSDERGARTARFGVDERPTRRTNERVFGDEPRKARAPGDFPANRGDARGAPARRDDRSASNPHDDRGGRSQREARRSPAREERRPAVSKRDDRGPQGRGGDRPSFGGRNEARGESRGPGRADDRGSERGGFAGRSGGRGAGRADDRRGEKPSFGARSEGRGEERRGPRAPFASREDRGGLSPREERRGPAPRGRASDSRGADDRKGPPQRGRFDARGGDDRKAPPSRGRFDARAGDDRKSPAPRAREGAREDRPSSFRGPPRDDRRPSRPSGKAGPPPRDDRRPPQGASPRSEGPKKPWNREGGKGGKGPRQNNDAAVSSAHTQDARGTRSKSPSRTKRPR